MQVREDNNTNIWHKRFAHVNHKAIRTMQYKGMVKGLPNVCGKTMVCETCNMGKQSRGIIPKKAVWRSMKRLELVHTDLCGPITPASQSGKRYVLVFIDDFTRKTWVYFLKNKSESFETFKKFKVFVETEVGTKIKTLRSDRGGEFTSHSFNEFCEQNGIKRQLTAAYTPQQNGVAERRNRTLMNMVRCLLMEKNVPKHFWAEATTWACHVLNRCVTRALDDKVPEELWSGNKPNVDYFRVFGCIGHTHIPSQNRTKLDPRSHKCVLFGISKESKAYRLYDPVQEKIVISCNVIFEEEKEWDWGKQKEEELVVEEEYLPGVEIIEESEVIRTENATLNSGETSITNQEQSVVNNQEDEPDQEEESTTQNQGSTADPNTAGPST